MAVERLVEVECHGFKDRWRFLYNYMDRTHLFFADCSLDLYLSFLEARTCFLKILVIFHFKVRSFV